MKNLLFSFATLLLMTSCIRHSIPEDPKDNWNGYAKYLKMGEVIHTLWAGKNINIGTVTYGIDDNANFYVTYDCSASGWLISETHMFAGDKADMPLNRPGAPKIGFFPHSGYHNPKVSTFTYRIPLDQLPPCASPGFVVASHCVVHNPSGQIETAWAEGDYTFADKGWGWYDTYYYNLSQNQSNILYGTTYTNDTLKLYYIDMSNGNAEMILKEYVGNAAGTYDGAAYDQGSGMFFFTNYDTGELWANLLTGEDPSFSAGTLEGIAASGTFYNQAYYYVNENLNTINMVTFNNDWTIACETVLDTIPGMVTVNDIAMDPAGDYLYIAGQFNGGSTELISWEVAGHAFYTLSVSINDGAQIAYGSDGNLYAIVPMDEGGGLSETYIINTGVEILTLIDDKIILDDDPFSDISNGPFM